MCLANVYTDIDKKLIMSSTSSVKVEGDKLVFRDLFGVRKEVAGIIKSIDLENNIVIIHENSFPA
ncbi:MAG: CooT family nickel-binding protein [Lachnospiraceae bacterium]|nr:CooT family nickel-binding protein [Lachnospiraceae bacterium]